MLCYLSVRARLAHESATADAPDTTLSRTSWMKFWCQRMPRTYCTKHSRKETWVKSTRYSTTIVSITGELSYNQDLIAFVDIIKLLICLWYYYCYHHHHHHCCCCVCGFATDRFEPPYIPPPHSVVKYHTVLNMLPEALSSNPQLVSSAHRFDYSLLLRDLHQQLESSNRRGSNFNLDYITTQQPPRRKIRSF